MCLADPNGPDLPAACLTVLGFLRAEPRIKLAVPLPAQRALPAGRIRPGRAGREAAVREIAAEAGFTRFRRAAETPFNLVYEIQP